ncbi:antirepressor [Gordonia phage Periwinkle]|nr:antirepressor [Gordonia phage Periwinkle]
MNDITLHDGGGSPFDAIRRTTPEGREYWSARDLMPLLGYDSWRRFADAVKRAKIAAQNSGHDVTSLFAGAVKKSDGRHAEDYHLARFACYLVAMSGDPRKPEVAAALSYFAVRTREAETRAPQPQIMTRDELLSRAVLEATTVINELKPKAEKFDRFLTADGDWSVSEAAGIIQRAGVIIGEQRLFDFLYEKRWTFRQKGKKWRAAQYAKERGWLSEKPQGEWTNPETGETHVRTPQTRVTPKGVDRLVEMLTEGRTA